LKIVDCRIQIETSPHPLPQEERVRGREEGEA